MKKSLLLAVVCQVLSMVVFGQYQEEGKKKEEVQEEETRNFKENFFTGGNISLAFYNNTFLIGASPIFGYSPTNWIDLGIVINYNYSTFRDPYSAYNDKLHQTVFGGGGFIKLYPIRFLFAHAQWEQNYVRQKYIPEIGNTTTTKFEASSFLIGGGYCTGRQGRGGAPFFYLSVLFDITNDINSPYTDGYGNTIPIIRGGIQVPLFQKKTEDF